MPKDAYEEMQDGIYPVLMMPEETILVCGKSDYESKRGLVEPMMQTVAICLTEAMTPKSATDDIIDQDENGPYVILMTTRETAALLLDEAQWLDIYTTEVASIKMYVSTGAKEAKATAEGDLLTKKELTSSRAEVARATVTGVNAGIRGLTRTFPSVRPNSANRSS